MAGALDLLDYGSGMRKNTIVALILLLAAIAIAGTVAVINMWSLQG